MNKLTTPFYTLREDTKKEIFALVNACKTVNLGNCSFEYYGLTETRFSLQEFTLNWELVVSTKAGRDIYKVNENEIVYGYSEK